MKNLLRSGRPAGDVTRRDHFLAVAVLGLIEPILPSLRASARDAVKTESQPKKEDRMTYHATGPFDVKLTPQPSEGSGASLSRMTIEKQFHADLEAVSRGEMLAAQTTTQGSAGYVAMETVSGTLGGRKGTFVLQHSGTIDRGKPRLSVTVVPDSGTEELRGLSGSMNIRIEAGGKHFYDFDYQIAEAP